MCASDVVGAHGFLPMGRLTTIVVAPASFRDKGQVALDQRAATMKTSSSTISQ
jgi:hypothetical protein